MQQLIYWSKPNGFDRSELQEIFDSAATNNQKVDVTGALLFRDDIFLQLLEGPVRAVETVFERIKSDPRHLDVSVLVRASIQDRLFPGWAMYLDEDSRFLWSKEMVTNGELRSLSARSIRKVFFDLATR